MERFSRTELLIGKEALEKLGNAHVAVFGVGGVGGYVVEALVRSGVRHFSIIDNDVVSLSNINRQIIATIDTVGMKKVDVMKKRMESINPNIEVNTIDAFFLESNKDEFDFSTFDYVVDAIDTVSGKIGLVLKCNENNVPIISSMGTGNKLDPTSFEVTDIYKTSYCPLAKVMRLELKKRGIKKLKVIYSKESPIKVENISDDKKKNIPGSIAFMPSTAGLIIASEVIKDIINK